MLDRLNAHSGRRWQERDSDGLGEYIASTFWDAAADYKNRLRVIVEGVEYVLDISLRSRAESAESEWTELLAYARDQLLPLLEARDIRETEDYTD
jgi:hypothetical protein